MAYSASQGLSKLAVIAVCFNPVRYETRYDLYRNFEQHMSDSGVFLLTVECLFESAPVFRLPKQVFEVTQANNPRHLQLTAPSILWMKENLINIAVKHLPERFEYVAWIDSDIEFDRPDWPQLTIDELQRYPIVQLFDVAHFLGPNGKNDILRRDHSFAYSIKHNKPIDPRRYNEWYPHPGYAWAMRRTAFNTIGGLGDFSILGSGDLHFAYALLNRIEATFPTSLTDDYRRTAVAWGQRVARVAQDGHDVGYVPVHIWHHWHGSRENRGYTERWRILERHQFAPSKDLERSPETGIIALANKRDVGKLQMSARLIGLERDIVAYFLSRKEDLKSAAPSSVQPIQSTQAPRKPNSTAATINKPTSSFFTSYSSRLPHIWSSGSASSHVHHDEFCWTDCTCSEHANCPHAEDCPCCIHYGEGEDHDQQENEHGEEQCPTENEDFDQDPTPDEHDHGEPDFQEESADLDEPGSFY